MKFAVSITVIALAVAGCAKRPDAITPMSMPTNAYAGLSCAQLATEYQRSSVALTTASKQQNDAATGDAVSVFLIGVPLASAGGGDKEGLVAQHKGELIAIQAAKRNKSC